MRLLSIIIPFYNTSKQIFDMCLQSILKQTDQRYEVIIVDDGSSQQYADMCDSYANIYHQIRVFHKHNGGVSSARNLGLRKVRGDVITFVDSDDWVDSRFVETILNNINDNDVLIFDGFIKEKDIRINHFFKSMRSFCELEKDELIAQAICFKYPINKYVPYHNGIGIVWGKAFNRSCIESYNITFNEGQRMSEDALFNIQVFLSTEKIYYINTAIYYYRCDNISACRSFDPEYIETNEMLLNNFRNVLQKNNIKSKSIEAALKFRTESCVCLALENYVFSTNNTNKKKAYKRLRKCSWSVSILNERTSKSQSKINKILLLLYRLNCYYILWGYSSLKNGLKKRRDQVHK